MAKKNKAFRARPRNEKVSSVPRQAMQQAASNGEKTACYRKIHSTLKIQFQLRTGFNKSEISCKIVVSLAVREQVGVSGFVCDKQAVSF